MNNTEKSYAHVTKGDEPLESEEKKQANILLKNG